MRHDATLTITDPTDTDYVITEDNLTIERALRDVRELASYGFGLTIDIPGDPELRKRVIANRRIEDS